MKNFIQRGETLTLTAPYAVSSGAGALVGSIFGVAAADYGSGAEGEFQVQGVFDLTRETGGSTAWSAGDLIYWDNTNKRATKTATSNKLIGVAVRAAADGDATGRVRLNGAFLS
jgi:predicted RecA/RadA family phage recombinase